MVKTTIREKVGNCPDRVVSFYVNQNWISTTHCACGKPLWKNLWRMWKTQSFQQVFCPFGFPPLLVETMHIRLHNLWFGCGTVMLRRRREANPWQKKGAKKFTKCKKSVSKFVVVSACPQYFCEKPLKIFPGIIRQLWGILLVSAAVPRGLFGAANDRFYSRPL